MLSPVLGSKNLLSKSGPILAPPSASLLLFLITVSANCFITLQPSLMPLSFLVSWRLRLMRHKGSLKRFWERFWTSSKARAKGCGFCGGVRGGGEVSF